MDDLPQNRRITASHPDRNLWLASGDDRLLRECVFSEFQSSGPGGQKRNRKYSAVRLSHLPSGIEVTAVESRSQNVNKLKALVKLRRRIAINVRCNEFPPRPKLDISLRNSQYPFLLAAIFDALHNCGFRIGDAGKKLGISTGKLVKILARDHEAWQHVNSERAGLNMSTLKTG